MSALAGCQPHFDLHLPPVIEKKPSSFRTFYKSLKSITTIDHNGVVITPLIRLWITFEMGKRLRAKAKRIKDVFINTLQNAIQLCYDEVEFVKSLPQASRKLMPTKPVLWQKWI
jgi:hypothetical protein